MAKATPQEIIDRLASQARPEDVDRVDRQFADKLGRLEQDGRLPDDVLQKLRAMWAMLRDDSVPWKSRALVMAALGYFASPLDLIPDLAGKPGYFDDAQIVRLVWNALER